MVRLTRFKDKEMTGPSFRAQKCGRNNEVVVWRGSTVLKTEGIDFPYMERPLRGVCLSGGLKTS